jgi:signal peptidase I
LLALPVVSFGQIEYLATSESMEPTIQKGDILYGFYIDYNKLEKGMIVLRGTVTHRLVRKVFLGGWVMKGDNNPIPDAEHLTKENYSGVIVFLKRNNTIFRLTRTPGTSIVVLENKE